MQGINSDAVDCSQQCDVDGKLSAWQCVAFVDQSKQWVTQFAGYQEHQCAVKCVPTAPAI